MSEARSKVLVFTTCYNERENIGPMIDGISSSVPDADILVVDDSSPDGTWDVIQERARSNPRLRAVKRPGKLGIGSAHKYALFYAMREGYDTVVTMDADFSHDPRAIPSLLAAHGKDVFVTGSRYCPGGRSDYSGYRDVVSRLGNVFARLVLGVKIHELTTYFRVFDVAALRRLPLRAIASSGYSYGVELVYHLRKNGVELREVPIHFVDRTHGASKIPRFQIFKSAFDLTLLGLRRLHLTRDLSRDEFVDDPCVSCGDRVLAMKHFGSRRATAADDPNVAEYRCTAVGASDYPPVYTCLACGLEQVPASLMPPTLESIYEEVVDETYIANSDVREKTYQRCFEQLQPWLPEAPGTMLEVGAYCGLFQQVATRRGWLAEGVEPSRWAAHYAREVSKANVHQGYLGDNRDRLRDKYDVVISWDVIEHVRRPVDFLVECGSYLKPGGLLAISTMDVGHWVPRALGTRWPWLMNMHLCYFSQQTMKDVLARAGFELLHAEPYVHYARVRHVLNGGLRVLPALLRRPFGVLAGLVPARWTLPVALGDIQMFVARKLR